MGISTEVLTSMSRGALTLDALAESTGYPRAAVVKAVQVLKRNGLVRTRNGRSAETGGLAPGEYAMTEKGVQVAGSKKAHLLGRSDVRLRKRTVGLRERIWWHLHTHRVATLTELLNTHATGSEKAAFGNVYKYLSALERAGIICRQGKRLPARQSRGRVVWMRVRDLGPKTPVVRAKRKEVYDPNSGQTLKMEEADV